MKFTHDEIDLIEGIIVSEIDDARDIIFKTKFAKPLYEKYLARLIALKIKLKSVKDSNS